MKALEGIKIVEFTTATAGPAASKLLVDYGAESILVEPKGGITNRNLAAHFDYTFNRKKSIMINMKTDEGKEIMDKLLEDADIFLFNYKTSAMYKFGMDYETLKKKFPKLICGYLTGYGEHGPMANDPGFDNTAFWGRSGLMHAMIEGETNTLPVGPSAVGDMLSGTILALGLMAALWNRQKTGEGMKVTTSLLGVGLFANHSQMIFAQQGVKYPKSRFRPNRAMSNSYLAKDGYVYLLTLNFARDFPKMLKCLDREDLIGDPRWPSIEYTTGDRAPELVKIINEATAKFTVAELKERFQAAGLALGEFKTTEDEMNDEQAMANGYLTKLIHGDKEYVVPATPNIFNDEAPEPMMMAEAPGHSTLAIMKDHGYSDEQIEKLLADGIIFKEED